MTLEEIMEDLGRNEDLSLLNLVKDSLSIVRTSTSKDEEIKMWIASAILDLHRNNINVEEYINNALIQAAIVLYVKGNFGFIDETEKKSEKKLAQENYKMLVTNLSLSTKYLLEEE